MNIRKAVVSGTQLAIGIGALIAGLPGGASGVATSTVTFVDSLVPNGRSKEDIGGDVEFRPQRAASYEAFGNAIEGMHQSAWLLMTLKPSLDGYFHSVAVASRAQKHLQEDARSAAHALNAIFLYGSIETQRSAKNVLQTFGDELSRLGDTKVNSASARQILSNITSEVGSAMTEFRQCAQADLGIATPV